MSDEGIKRIESMTPATPNRSSIMSAPREKNKTGRILIIIATLIISITVNVVLAVLSISKNERIHQLETEVVDYKNENTELKNKLNSLETL